MEYWSNGVMEEAKKYNVFEAFLNTPTLQHSTDLTRARENLSVGGAHPTSG
jgi:hypothetical protein